MPCWLSITSYPVCPCRIILLLFLNILWYFFRQTAPLHLCVHWTFFVYFALCWLFIGIKTYKMPPVSIICFITESEGTWVYYRFDIRNTCSSINVVNVHEKLFVMSKMLALLSALCKSNIFFLWLNFFCRNNRLLLKRYSIWNWNE